MHPYCPAMPGMKTIENFTHIPNMGVALLSCIITNETTKAKTISCSSLLQRLHHHALTLPLRATNGWVVCSSFTNRPHEMFDLTPSNSSRSSM
jgi:hypothetical protein